MRALFNDLSVVHDHDTIRITHCREAVRNDYNGAVFFDELHIFLEDLFGLIVQRSGRFV